MKIRSYLLALVLLFSGITTTLQASETKAKALTETRVAEIRQRVDQIKSMDVTTLSRAERKGLKHELKEMKSELRSDPVIYISAGALILIIVLLIILL